MFDMLLKWMQFTTQLAHNMHACWKQKQADVGSCLGQQRHVKYCFVVFWDLEWGIAFPKHPEVGLLLLPMCPEEEFLASHLPCYATILQKAPKMGEGKDGANEVTSRSSHP